MRTNMEKRSQRRLNSILKKIELSFKNEQESLFLKLGKKIFIKETKILMT